MGDSNSIDTGIEDLVNLYNRIKAYIDTTRGSCRGMLLLVNDQLNAVKKIRDGLGDATHYTHVGAPQCREALDVVIKNLTEAVDKLAVL